MKLSEYNLEDPKFVEFMESEGLQSELKLMRRVVDRTRKGGCVYLIQLGDTDVFKIGISIDPFKRQKQLQSKSPIPLYLIKYWFGHDHEHTERCLHEMFGDKRVRGEWFKLSVHDVHELIGYVSRNNRDDTPLQLRIN